MIDIMKRIILVMSLLLSGITFAFEESTLPISETLMEQLRLHPGLEDITKDGCITHEEADAVTFLFLNNFNFKLSSIEELSYFQNLTHLSLQGQNLKDITPLGQLQYLEYLELDQNQIIDISPLKELEHLSSVSLSDNYIDFNESSNKAWLEAKGLTEAMLSSKPYISNLSISSSAYTFDLFDLSIPVRTSKKEISLIFNSMLADRIEMTFNDIRQTEVELGKFHLALIQGNNQVEIMLVNQYHTVHYNITIYYEPLAVTTRRPVITSSLLTTSVETPIVVPVTSHPSETLEVGSSDPASDGIETTREPVEIPLTSNSSQNIETVKNENNIQNKASHTAIGFLHVKGADIHHDIFQSEDNAYFLKHNRNHVHDPKGELFLDYRHHDTSGVSLIYGHHMRDGSMFGKLIQYRYEGHMRKHPYAYFTYGNGTEQYEVIAAFFYDTTKDRFDYTTAITKEISKFLSERTLYQKVPITETDRLLLLSTCNYDSFGDRFVVVLKKSENAVNAKNSKS